MKLEVKTYDKEGIVQKAIRHIRKNYSDKFLIVTDVCMCEYTSHWTLWNITSS